VLQVEAVRVCRAIGRAMDTALLLEAVRQTDLLLVHVADPWELVLAARVDHRSAGMTASRVAAGGRVAGARSRVAHAHRRGVT
jgi:hypothetical protein